MKEETFKEYNWHNEEVVEIFRKLGVKGTIINFYSDNEHGLFLHIKTKTESKEK